MEYQTYSIISCSSNIHLTLLRHTGMDLPSNLSFRSFKRGERPLKLPHSLFLLCHAWQPGELRLLLVNGGELTVRDKAQAAIRMLQKYLHALR